jgi:Ion channel
MPDDAVQSTPPPKKTSSAPRRFFLLFLFLLGNLILYPFAEGTGIGYYLFRTSAYAVVLLSIYAVSFRRTLLVVVIALAAPAAIHHLFLTPSDASIFSIINTILSLVFDGLIVVVIFRKVFARGRVNAETIYGALCIYLLIGFAFAGVYGLIWAVGPNSFYLNPTLNVHLTPNRFDFVYYSFATMTSLGSAGITPVTGQARSISVMEAITGILYLAVLISRLMADYRDHNGSAQL